MPSYYNTLIVSAGTIKTIYSLGSLQYCYDMKLLEQISTYIGTSTGAIIVYLLSIGYTPLELIAYMCTHDVFRSFQNINIISLMNKQGVLPFYGFQEHLEQLTINKIGFLPTLNDLYVKFGKKLVLSTYNYTKGEIEYISIDNHADLPCIVALHMSCALPLLFDSFKYMDHYYIDASISESFAIHAIPEENKTNTLGIMIDHVVDTDYESSTIIDYIQNLFTIPLKRLEPDTETMDIIHIRPEEEHNFHLFLSTKEKLDKFSEGYEMAHLYFTSQ
jgi:predicted acylesterase/phospholipase RssA